MGSKNQTKIIDLAKNKDIFKIEIKNHSKKRKKREDDFDLNKISKKTNYNILRFKMNFNLDNGIKLSKLTKGLIMKWKVPYINFGKTI